MTLFATVVLTVGLYSSAQAADQVLVLSGGGSPASNHYSQYLQTRSMYLHLKHRLSSPVDLYFGAGNRPGQPADLADVHKTEHDDAGDFDRFLVGEIENNHPATKPQLLDYFDHRLAPSIDTFFLLVSDHGMANDASREPDGRYSNNCIDLWNAGVKNEAVTELDPEPANRCLSKNELRKILAEKVHARRKVFAMSQCFSGGFHQMSVDEKSGFPKADPSVCGFTAVTHDTWASGCSPDVDGPTYQGYERSFTEQLTGYDYVREKQLRPARGSFAEAHEAALLEDLAVDIPLATSDYYLWRWALKITKPSFQARNGGDTAKMRAAFAQAADFKADAPNAAFAARKKLFLKMKQVIRQHFPELSETIALPEPGLDAQVDVIGTRMDQLEKEFGAYEDEADRIYDQYAFTLWMRQFERGSSLSLTGEEREIESMILKVRDTESPIEKLTPVLWAKDPDKAMRVAEYLGEREDRILDYALTNGDLASATRLRRIKELEEKSQALGDELDSLAKAHGLSRRMLIYRQILGAWAALEAGGDSEALRDLQGLLECERTKL